MIRSLAAACDVVLTTLILVPVSPAPARAIVVEGVLADLPDTIPGQDRWQTSFYGSGWTVVLAGRRSKPRFQREV